MRFLQPDYATWFLAIPLAFACWFLYFRSKLKFRQRAGIGSNLQRISRLSTSRRDIATLLAATLALGMLVLAMMHPQLLLERQIPQYQRFDMVLILDRSVSMYAQDIKPSRFRRAVQEIRNFLIQKPEAIDRVALIGFADSPIVLTNLTSDLNSLLFYLDWIVEDEQLYFGTNIGAALNSARELTEKDQRGTPKIYVVLSDGDDFGEDLQTAVRSFRRDRSRIHTIGIGGDAAVRIPVMELGKVTYLRDEQEQILTTQFSGNTLTAIANATGGRYFRSVTGNEMALVMREILSTERRLIGWTTATEYRDVYREALMVAALATFFLVMKL
jgi:Ca-activated chloride channel family protein